MDRRGEGLVLLLTLERSRPDPGLPTVVHAEDDRNQSFKNVAMMSSVLGVARPLPSNRLALQT